MTRRKRMRYCAPRRAFYPHMTPVWAVVAAGEVGFTFLTGSEWARLAFDVTWCVGVFLTRITIWKRRHPIVLHHIVLHIADPAVRREIERTAPWN